MSSKKSWRFSSSRSSFYGWKKQGPQRSGESESEVAQSCPTLCNPMDCSLPGSSVHGIFQAKVLEWVAISFSRGSSQPRELNPGHPHCESERKWKSLSHVRLFVTPWTIWSMDLSRSEYGVGSLSLLQGIFPIQGSDPGFLHSRQILNQLSHQGSPRILEWVAYSLSSGSFRPKNWIRVSHIAGRFFTNWAIREAHIVSRCFIVWAIREDQVTCA